MAHYHGRRGLVYIAGVGDALAQVLHLNSWTLDQNVDFAEITAFGDKNKQYVGGRPDCKGALEGSWDDADDAMYDLMQSTDGVFMHLYPSTLVPTKYWYGLAWTDFSIDCSASDAVKISGNFAAQADWYQF